MIQVTRKFALATLALIVLPGGVLAQTCSCAGVPILGAMESATPGDDRWFISSTFEYHDISELVRGSTTLPNETGRERTTEALIFEVSTGLTEKLAFTALLSTARHERTVGGRQDTASGVGDAIAMLKYSPATISLYSKTALSVGVGAQLPVGRDDVKSEGTVLSEDLQPSTGAFGGVVWLYAARALNESRGARVYGTATYTHKGENDRDYHFGHSTTLGVGTSYQTQTPWGFNLELLYRHADRDERARVEIPNTGGRWLDIIPAVQYHVNESLALKALVKIPVSRNLNDQLQFTTKYAVSLSASYVFGKD